MRYCLYIFAFLITADTAILDGQFVKKGNINLKPIHLQIILIELTKFCSAYHEILAFRQNRAREQEVGHCDLILL